MVIVSANAVSGQTVMLRSRDNGETWTDRAVVLPYTDTTANWDCGICELADGTLCRLAHDGSAWDCC